MAFIEPTVLTNEGFVISAWPVKQNAGEDGSTPHPPGLNVLVEYEGETAEFVVGVPDLIRAMGDSLGATAQDVIDKAIRESGALARVTAERDALLIDVEAKNEEIESLQDDVAELACQACCAPLLVIEFSDADADAPVFI